MLVDFLLERFQTAADRDAVFFRDKPFSFAWLRENILRRIGELDGLPPGAVVSLESDFSPDAAALFLALIAKQAILVPIAGDARDPGRLRDVAEAEWTVAPGGPAAPRATGRAAGHPLYARLRELGRPGLVIFSSGSAGQSKAALHDCTSLLDRYRIERRSPRTVNFLLPDHIGGVDTILWTLSGGGCLVAVPGRDPDAVLKTVQQARAEHLPVTPTFLNLLLLCEAHRRYDLSSLKSISYGTEPMPPSTLERARAALPRVEFRQAFGMSELGVLPCRSRDGDSCWVKLGGEGCETRVVDGILQVKARSAMLGYLNAPSPFTDDGWMNTGDAVEVDGEWMRIVGRRSELINVGGEKIHPVEIESVLLSLPNVAEVTVYAEENALTGQSVAARFRLLAPEAPSVFRGRVRAFCRGKLRPHQVPARIQIVDALQHGGRFKKIRGAGGPPA